jgi:hypothetical protein
MLCVLNMDETSVEDVMQQVYRDAVLLRTEQEYLCSLRY